MTNESETTESSPLEIRKQALVAQGLSRIKDNHANGRDMGILSAAKVGMNDEQVRVATRNLVKHLRKLGYSPIHASKEWDDRSSLIVPGMRREHLKRVGDEFGQEAVIHYSGRHKKAHCIYLKASGSKAGHMEEIGGEKKPVPPIPPKEQVTASPVAKDLDQDIP